MSATTAGARRAPTMSRRWLLAAIITPILVVLYVVLRNESWVYDDNLFLVYAHQQGFNLDWLLSFKYQHWDIAYNALYSLLLHLWPLDFRWALVLMLATLGGAAVLFERILELLFGIRGLAVLLAGWFSISVLFVRGLQWWATGAQILPATFFELLCLYAWLRYRAGGAGRWLAISGGALAAALLFYEKPAYMVLYLALIRVLFLSEDLHPRAVARAFWRERLQWGMYISIVGLWLAAYLSRDPYLAAGPVGAGQYLSFFRIFWVNTLVPALGGVIIPAAGLTGAQILFVSIAQVVVVATVIVSVARKPSAWRAWAFLAICVLVIGGLVARSRVAQFSVAVANDTRYQVELAWLVPLVVCFAFSRGVTLSPQWRSERPRTLPLPTPRSAKTVALALLCAAYVGASIVSAVHLVNIWPGAIARTWQTHLQTGLAQAQRSARPVVIADNTTPYYITTPEPGFNLLSELLPLYDAGVRVDGPLDGPLGMIDAEGHVHPAAVGSAIGDGSMAHLVRVGDIKRGAGSRLTPHGGGICLSSASTPIDVERTLSSPPTATAPPEYLWLAYSSSKAVSLAIGEDDDGGNPVGRQGMLALSPKAGGSIFWLGTGMIRHVRLDIPPNTTVCLDRMDIVTLTGAGHF